METSLDPGRRPRQREKLISPGRLLIVALVALLLLVVLVPSPYSFQSSAVNPDRVSLSYLRLLSAARPNDLALKLHLVRTLLGLNQIDEAEKLLSSLKIDDPSFRPWAWRLGLQLHIAQFTRNPESARDPKLSQQVASEIEALLGQPLSVDELTKLAAASLLVVRPDLAARIYLRLVNEDPAQRKRWLLAAAEQLHASGNPAEAALRYDELVQLEKDAELARGYALRALTAATHAGRGSVALDLAARYAARFPKDPEILNAVARLALANAKPAVAGRYYDELFGLARDDEERKRYARLALTSMSAADQAGAALSAIRRYLPRVPSDPALLDLGINLALANKQARLAQEWGRALLAQDPKDPAKIARQIDLELGVGDPVAALELARRLVSRNPNDLKLRRRLAQLAEWAGKPRDALVEWANLAARSRDRDDLGRALKLAPALWELEILADLLELQAKRGRLTDTELASLVRTFEDIGEPERLVAILVGYLGRFPDHQKAWEALARVHERRGDLDSALATWERIGREFGSDQKEIVHRAELLWQLHRASEAYVLLRDALDHAGVAKTHDLLRRAELASSAKNSLSILPPGAPRPEGKSEGKPESKEDTAEQDELLGMLGKLFWFSEPSPETMEEYRHLWRAGAMVAESAARYVMLAKSQGLIEEAITVSEAAFKRFKDPDFLLSAMDLAYNAGRWKDLERLIETAHQNVELVAASKSYYYILAGYYIHLGDYERAQRVYLRLIEMEPETVAARAELLWMLIDHSNDRARQQGKRNRYLLAKLLTDWRHLAQEEPALWLPFATGWSMLGRTKEALSYYEREWVRRPDDHLWLLGYVSTLDAVSRSSDARVVRRFALNRLRAEAERAAHPGSTRTEREILNAYVGLVREVYGPGKGSRWLTGVLRSDLEPAVQRGLAAAWRSSDDNVGPSAWITDSSTVTQRNPWGRFPKAPLRRGQQLAVATIADPGSAPDESEEPPPAPLLVNESEAGSGEEAVPSHTQLARIEAGVQSINDLVIFSGAAVVRLARGQWAVGARVGVNQLFLGDSDPSAGSTEVEIAGTASYRHRRGLLELGIGGNLRTDASLVTGWLTETVNTWRGGTLQLGVHINELANDTRWLRVYGARHRATLGMTTSLFSNAFLGLQGNFYRYHTRTNEEVGLGANAEIDIGYRIRRVKPLWTVRASASYTRNFHLADQLTEFGSSSSYARTLSDVLPLEFAAVGVGTHFEHRFPGVAPIGAGRFRYMGDVWLGWMWPINIPGFEIRAGVGFGLPRRQELTLTGFVANNRWLGPGVVNAGLTLGYQFR